MSEEEEFDGEKTQFWLPGQAPPGLLNAGDREGANLKQPTQSEQRKPAPMTGADKASAGEIDFDLTAEEQPGSTGLDFDLSTGENADTVDFDITGEGTIPPEPEAKPVRKASPVKPSTPKQARAPAPPADSGVSGGTLLLVAVIAIAGAVIYFATR
jgi:hypothetical protein